MPSIVIGIFAFEVVVRPMHKPSTLAASIALAVLMLPIMVRADEEAIRSVAVDLQEAGAALGASRWRVVRSVVLRGSLPGLVAGNLLALARAMGETAPLLFTLAAPTLALTWLIYTDATEPFPAQQQLAWAAALVLLAAVFVFSVLARAHRLVAHEEGKMTSLSVPDAVPAPNATPWRQGTGTRPATGSATGSATGPARP